jgi:DNA-binding NtrC family response regulator
LAKDKFRKYSYPGNVRELKPIIELAYLLCNGCEMLENNIQFNNVKGDELIAYNEKTLKDYTNDIITFFLNKYKQDVLEVAKRLDIVKSTIYNLIQKKETSIK